MILWEHTSDSFPRGRRSLSIQGATMLWWWRRLYLEKDSWRGHGVANMGGVMVMPVTILGLQPMRSPTTLNQPGLLRGKQWRRSPKATVPTHPSPSKWWAREPLFQCSCATSNRLAVVTVLPAAATPTSMIHGAQRPTHNVQTIPPSVGGLVGEALGTAKFQLTSVMVALTV